MGAYSVTTMAADVNVAMDTDYSADWEVATGDSDTLTRTAVVQSVLADAVRRVHLAAPVYMLEEGHTLRGDMWWEEDGHKALLLLPANFLRLIKIRLTDWRRAVYEAAVPDGRLWERQNSGYPGLRGTPQRPVAVMTMTPQGRALELFGSRDASATIAEGVYVPEPIITDNRIWVSDDCYRPAVLLAASLTATSLGEAERGAVLYDMAQKLLNTK